jgi:hypothetical protein
LYSIPYWVCLHAQYWSLVFSPQNLGIIPPSVLGEFIDVPSLAFFYHN